jgi:hypothetical protein
MVMALVLSLRATWRKLWPASITASTDRRWGASRRPKARPQGLPTFNADQWSIGIGIRVHGYLVSIDGFQGLELELPLPPAVTNLGSH